MLGAPMSLQAEVQREVEAAGCSVALRFVSVWGPLGSDLKRVWGTLSGVDRTVVVTKARSAAGTHALRIPGALGLLAAHIHSPLLPLVLRDPGCVGETPEALLSLLESVASRTSAKGKEEEQDDDPDQDGNGGRGEERVAVEFAEATFALEAAVALEQIAAHAPERLGRGGGEVDEKERPVFDVAALLASWDESDSEDGDEDGDGDGDGDGGRRRGKEKSEWEKREAWWLNLAMNVTAIVVLLAFVMAGVVRWRDAYGYAWQVVEEFPAPTSDSDAWPL